MVNRLLEAQLVDVSPADPATFISASAALTLAAILGCAIPAWRATRTDPITVLRQS